MKEFFEKFQESWENDCTREMWLNPETFNLLSYEGNVTVRRGDTRVFFSAVSEDGILDMILSFKSALYDAEGITSTVQVLSITWTDEKATSYSFAEHGFKPVII